jgi:Tfp pilus assembly protein PilW
MTSTPKERASTRAPAGFSLIELVISLGILMLVVGLVVDGIVSFQQRNVTEVNNVADAQEVRQFMDQILNDLRQAGYPGLKMYDPSGLTSATVCASDTNVACGIVSLTTTAIQFEGDVDGSGVSEVYIQLVQSGGTTVCTTPPCTLQRGTVLKSAGGSPAYYTEVENVMNTSVFSAYDYGGNPITLPASASDLPNIKNVGVVVAARATHPDLSTGAYPTINMTSEARVNN